MKMKRIREEDCYDYIKAVQQTGKYNEYLLVMKEFNSLPYDMTALKFVTAKIKDVFRDHSNLILRFNILFLPEQYAIEQDGDGADQNQVLSLKSTQRVQAADSNKVLLHEDYKFLESIRKEKFKNPDEYKRFLKCLYVFSEQKISRDDLGGIVNDLLQYGTAFVPGTASEDKVHEEPAEKDEREKSTEASTSKRRKIEEPAMFARLFSCSTENPSYEPSTERTLASGWTELGKQVLNDSWVPRETPDPTYIPKKNIYQQNLFKFEDDRCERHRQKELVKGTVERMEKLLKKVADNEISLECIRLEDHFKVLHLGCIRRLYGESWQGVMDELSKNAVSVLQGILALLLRKLEEVTGRLSECYKDKMRVIYAKNLHKSLNHGNSSCEHQDTTSSSDRDDASNSSPKVLAEATK
ncbi:hypothetical protein MKW94_020443 [Papaver nudicaule]|uniref:Histone deacetylase interacting domain-containing protein n=1 Tax=Papaver nudicaule TaxID=74823 RepID=A0AA41V9Q1_PAPNU|nr:hypothetical protein [Papaver nudicaule]